MRLKLLATTNFTVNLLVDYEFCENQITLVKDGIVVFVIYCSIHQRMGTNEVEYRVGEACRVINASARPGLRNLRVENWQPSWVWCRLLLELSCRQKEADKRSIKYRQEKVFHFRILFLLTSTSELSCSILQFLSILIENCQYSQATFCCVERSKTICS